MQQAKGFLSHPYCIRNTMSVISDMMGCCQVCLGLAVLQTL